MPALLPPRRCPWTWPASLAGAVCLLLVLLALPAAWWDQLWPGRLPAGRQRAAPAHQTLRLVEVSVLPPAAAAPLAVTTEPPDHESPLADWWQSAWLPGPAAAVPRARLLALTPPDSLAAPLRLLLDTRATVETILAVPDSVIAACLWWLEETASLTADDRDGFYTRIARARAYADLKSREAAMFGEFQFETVPITK
jgi:hypothetical protein